MLLKLLSIAKYNAIGYKEPFKMSNRTAKAEQLGLHQYQVCS